MLLSDVSVTSSLSTLCLLNLLVAAMVWVGFLAVPVEKMRSPNSDCLVYLGLLENRIVYHWPVEKKLYQ